MKPNEISPEMIRKALEQNNPPAHQYQVELVWNREFHFVPYGEPCSNIDDAIRYAKALENMGDGESVKKTQIVDEAGNVVWAYGTLLSNVQDE
jgi:hypothetical protein